MASDPRRNLPALLLAAALPMAAAEPVSWFRDVTPIFQRSCNGCHNPNKLKGGVDTSSHAGFAKPGKHGPNYVAGNPGASRVLETLIGPEPEMPAEGDPLSPGEVDLITRWIGEGARDDTPAAAGSTRLDAPPVYRNLPVLTAMDVSPDGSRLAVAAYHEVLLFDTATLTRQARLVGDSPRIEAVAFSPDGSRLAVAGGAPARFGEVQVWDIPSVRLMASHRVTGDTVFGISWSPDGDRIAVGATDNSVRVLAVSDGREVLRFDNHSDWVLRTAWIGGGNRVLSAGRDRALKLIDASTAQFIDDVNKLVEPVLGLARHPSEEWVAYGGALGGLRIYRARENQERTAANNDVNLVREFERQPGPVNAVAFSPDGSLLAAGGTRGDVRVYRTGDGVRTSSLEGHEGAVFSLAFSADGSRVFTGGFDGLLREFEVNPGRLVTILVPVPLTPDGTVATDP